MYKFILILLLGISLVCAYLSGIDIVIRVIDGDTVQTLLHGTVRYLWVNTPELSSSIMSERCLALRATEFSARLVLIKPVRLVHWNSRDKYGRVLAIMYVMGDSISIQEHLLKSGLAAPMWLGTPPADLQQRWDLLYNNAEPKRQKQKALCQGHQLVSK